MFIVYYHAVNAPDQPWCNAYVTPNFYRFSDCSYWLIPGTWED